MEQWLEAATGPTPVLQGVCWLVRPVITLGRTATRKRNEGFGTIALHMLLVSNRHASLCPCPNLWLPFLLVLLAGLEPLGLLAEVAVGLQRNEGLGTIALHMLLVSNRHASLCPCPHFCYPAAATPHKRTSAPESEAWPSQSFAAQVALRWGPPGRRGLGRLVLGRPPTSVTASSRCRSHSAQSALAMPGMSNMPSTFALPVNSTSLGPR